MNNSYQGSNLFRDLFIFDDENNIRSSQTYTVWPITVLDQVYDHLTPTKKTLRQIIEDLRQEIITGGTGNIIFPVTSVNGKRGDIIITKSMINLANVDNTKDIDKVLSTPQRNELMNILASYNFNVNLDKLYEHLVDMNNPHGVTLNQLNASGAVSQFVDTKVGIHNTSASTHFDIRRNLAQLWNLVEDETKSLGQQIKDVMQSINTHMDDPLAHGELFSKKEDNKNKTPMFAKDTNNNHKFYPSTKAVIDYVDQALVQYKETLPDVKDWIANIIVTNTSDDLPIADSSSEHQAYLIRDGGDGRNAIAICRQNPSGNYFWDITSTGNVSNFDMKYFMPSSNGLSLNIPAIFATESMIDELFDFILSDDNKGKFVRSLTILPGTMDGCIRYYINNDMTTMSTDIRIPGLRNLAFQEWITEINIFDQAVHERHFLGQAVSTRALADKSVTGEKIPCGNQKVIGNVISGTDHAHEIPMTTLADYLRPLIYNIPDPELGKLGAIIDSMCYYLWEPGILRGLTANEFGIRFTGTISALPNTQISKMLTTDITSSEYKLLATGGTWTLNSTTDAETTLIGGSNITGLHTFANVELSKDGIRFESLTTGDRMNAPYDVYLKLKKKP